MEWQVNLLMSICGCCEKGKHGDGSRASVFILYEFFGNGLGYSVKEVIEVCEQVTGIKANVVMTDRRAGDPARLVALSKLIFKELGWKAERSLEEIAKSAWEWHKKQVNAEKQ